jgi:hypothetical protein
MIAVSCRGQALAVMLVPPSVWENNYGSALCTLAAAPAAHSCIQPQLQLQCLGGAPVLRSRATSAARVPCQQ